MLRRAVPGQGPPRRGPGHRRQARQRRRRRHPRLLAAAPLQKLVEEAPAPFLTDDQRARIHASAKAICKEAGYYGAGTVEYLVQGDTVSFLEVNTRLQVEHPVTEETAGIDLVRQQFLIANGEELSIKEDPTPRGHSFEFRINGEDAGRGFMPAPGPITVYKEPTGPGVRVDSGVVAGDVIGGQFDSMLAKLIVTGENREQALQRAARALAEFEVDGLATVIPFHRHIVENPAFIGDGEKFDVYTKWIETEWDNPIEPFAGSGAAADDEETSPSVGRRRGRWPSRRGLAARSFSIGTGGAPAGVIRKKPKARKRGGAGGGAASGDAVTAPMQGTVVKVAVEEGQEVAEGDLIVVLEAMKMENPVTAHKAGVVTGLAVEAGAAITQGTVLAELK